MQILTKGLAVSPLRKKLFEKTREGGEATAPGSVRFACQPPQGKAIGDRPGRIADFSVRSEAKFSNTRRELQSRARDITNRALTRAAARNNNARREWATAPKRF